MSVKRDLENVVRLYGQAAVDRALMEGGFGGTKQVGENIRSTQGQTPYKGGSYIDEQDERARARMLEDRALSHEDKFQNERIKQARVQTDFVNRVASDDQANRAQAALEILRGYNQARESNQRFIQQLNANPL